MDFGAGGSYGPSRPDIRHVAMLYILLAVTNNKSRKKRSKTRKHKTETTINKHIKRRKGMKHESQSEKANEANRENNNVNNEDVNMNKHIKQSVTMVRKQGNATSTH